MTLPAQARQNTDSLPTSSPSDSDPQSMYVQDVMLPHVAVVKDGPRAPQIPMRQAESGPAPTIQTESLAKVYEQSGVSSPKHGFTILKIADMLGSAHLRDLALDGKRSAILMALEANGVQINDVIEDAAHRDAALNQYEARQQKTFQDFKNWKQQQNREIQSEIDLLVEACRSRIEENEKEIATEKARLDDWRMKKREEERRIRTASSHFVQMNGLEQNAGSAEPAVRPEVAPESASAKPRPAEPRVPESVAAPNGKATLTQDAANGKRLSLWKR